MTKNHIIICGLGLLGTVLVERFSEKGYPVVVIEKNPQSDEIELCKTAGASILLGDAQNKQLLMKAGVNKAAFLISVTGDDEINAEIAGLASRIPRSGMVGPLTCYLHIVDLNLYTLLKETEFQNTQTSIFRLDLFNIFQNAGTAILNCPEPFLKQGTDPASVRLLLIGFGRVGESLLFQAVKQWQVYYSSLQMKLPITIIDKNAEQKIESFFLRYPSVRKYCDVQQIIMDINTSEFLRTDFLEHDSQKNAFTRIFICVGNPILAFSAGLVVHKKLQRCNTNNRMQKIPIVIRTNRETGLSRYLETMKTGSDIFSNLHMFPIIDENCNLDLILNTTHERIAQAFHLYYVKNERVAGHMLESYPRMTSWQELPDEYKNSNRYQADHIIEKLRAINCGIVPIIDWDEPLFDISPYVEQLAEIEHERWIKEKITAGWKWGQNRDDRWWHKRHPLIIPFIDLPESEKEKDRLAVKLIPALLKSVDLKVKQM